MNDDMSASGRKACQVHERRTVYQGRYRMVEARYGFETPAGDAWIDPVSREIFERGDSAAALLHDVDRDMIILTEQFRIATLDPSRPDAGSGYFLETPAGSLEPGEAPDAGMRRELLEETGYRADRLEPICTFYPSPGASSERVHLFYAPVRTADLADPDAQGLAEEQEHILRVDVPREDFLKGLETGRYADGKLLMAGYWLKAQPGAGKP